MDTRLMDTGPNGALQSVGKRLPRVDARERVTGSAVYPADLKLAGHGARQDVAQPARARPHPPHRHGAR